VIDNDRGIEIASAEYEASAPPCEKLTWETRVMLVVPRDTAVQFACSLVAAMGMSPVPGQGLSRKGKGTQSECVEARPAVAEVLILKYRRDRLTPVNCLDSRSQLYSSNDQFGGEGWSATMARRLTSDGLGVEPMGCRGDFQLFLVVGDGGNV